MSEGDVPDMDDGVVEDVDQDETTIAPPPPEMNTLDGISTKQILIFAQTAVVLIGLIIIIVIFLCRPKKKDEKKLEDTNYPAVEQVCEEQKQTRSQVILRKTQTSEEATE